MASSISNYLKSNPAPIIDGDRVTFVWKGRKAPGLVGDFNGWDDDNAIVMEKSEPGTWAYQHIFELDAYIEYSYQIQGEPIIDPYNPQKTPNGVGGFNNYLYMPKYSPSTLSRKKRNIPHGKVVSFNLPTDYFITGTRRGVHLYNPPVDHPVPLVVVWDGQDYLNRIHLNYMLDNLIYQGAIKPVALAMVDNAGPDLRTIEYACSDATIAFLKYEVLPLASRELDLVNIEAMPGAYGVLGASMGGLMALYTGLRMPEVFGKILSQSGAFTWADFDTVVYDLVNFGDVLPLTVWMDSGLYDLPGIPEANQRMQEQLSKRGYSSNYQVYHAGHNYPSWRDDLQRGFETLFGT